MAQSITFKKAQTSKLKRLKFLPRIGVTVDFAGKSLTYKYAPLIETLFNILDKEVSFNRFIKASIEQLDEISITKKTD